MKRLSFAFGLQCEQPWFLALVIAVGALLRLWNLGSNPGGFFCDEAAAGNAVAGLLTNGRDTYGNFLPILFRGFGGWRSPAIVYPIVPTALAFGFTEFAVRLPSALYGIASVGLGYLLGRQIVSHRVGMIAAILMAVSPWAIHASRIAFDAHVCVFFGALTLYTILRARSAPILWPFAGIAYAFFLFSYPASFVQAALILPVTLLVFRRELPRWWASRSFRWTLAAVGIPTLALVVYGLVDGVLLLRYRQTAPESRNWLAFLNAYLAHFSRPFLAVHGESGMHGAAVVRHSMLMGLLLPYQFGLFLFGTLVALSRVRYRPQYTLLLVFLLVAPVPAAMVSDVPAALRSVMMLVPVTLLSAIAVDAIIVALGRRLSWISYAAVAAFVAFGTYSVTQALQAYPRQSSGWNGWQYGFGEAMKWASKHRNDYDSLYVSHRFNGAEMLLHFYRVDHPCPNCFTQNNPIVIRTDRKEYFFARKDDIDEAKRLYPQLVFRETQRIVEPSGDVALYGGTFEAVSDRDLATGKGTAQ